MKFCHMTTGLSPRIIALEMASPTTSSLLEIQFKVDSSKCGFLLDWSVIYEMLSVLEMHLFSYRIGNKSATLIITLHTNLERQPGNLPTRSMRIGLRSLCCTLKVTSLAVCDQLGRRSRSLPLLNFVIHASDQSESKTFRQITAIGRFSYCIV